jgi:hypothetical protein
MGAEQQRERFRADISAMKLKTGRGRQDGLVQWLGVALMVIGTAAAFIVYEASQRQSDARNIGSEQILAVAFLAVTVAGAALFLSASLAKFLRIWLLRQLYDGQAHVDQILAALDPDRTRLGHGPQ